MDEFCCNLLHCIKKYVTNKVSEKKIREYEREEFQPNFLTPLTPQV